MGPDLIERMELRRMCTLVVQWTTRSHSIEAGSTQRAAADGEGTMHAAVRVWRAFAPRHSKGVSRISRYRRTPRIQERARDRSDAFEIRCRLLHRARSTAARKKD